MENNFPLIEILLNNKNKILEVGKYNEKEFKQLIDSVTAVETERQEVLNKIKELGSIDVPKLQSELGQSEESILCKIESLRELGLLGFIGEKPRFFAKYIENYEIKGIFPTTDLIKDSNLCCGCGLCVSVCPVNAIDYVEDNFKLNKDLCIKCGLCYSACPRSFFPKPLEKLPDNDDTNVKFIESFHYFRDIFTAQTTDKRIREVAQDGGIVTTLLKTAFREGLVDGSFAVTTGELPLKPLPILIESEEELLKTAGTKYTNVPLLKIFRDAKDRGKIAVVGTPCIMKALRKLSLCPINKP
ncbi:MAG: coenzyme F420 hydrogenase/dehydrogenase beta subunit N-terminal domain-containing protein, partial [Candidatus Thorarchaeota archaeon]